MCCFVTEVHLWKPSSAPSLPQAEHTQSFTLWLRARLEPMCQGVRRRESAATCGTERAHRTGTQHRQRPLFRGHSSANVWLGDRLRFLLALKFFASLSDGPVTTDRGRACVATICVPVRHRLLASGELGLTAQCWASSVPCNVQRCGKADTGMNFILQE